MQRQLYYNLQSHAHTHTHTHTLTSKASSDCGSDVLDLGEVQQSIQSLSVLPLPLRGCGIGKLEWLREEEGKQCSDLPKAK